jgi:hypothetical protein
MPLLVRSEILTAENHMIVYKKVKMKGDQIVSPYHEFHWQRDRIYHVPQLTFVDIDGRIRKRNKVNWVNEGFHAYIEKRCCADPDPSFLIAKMIIPKGSKYVLGAGYHIVSDTMIFYNLL